ALPLTTLAYERVRPPLERTPEFRLASYVFEGQVKDIQRLDLKGKQATGGPRFPMEFKGKGVRKTRAKEKRAAGQPGGGVRGGGGGGGGGGGEEKEGLAPGSQGGGVALPTRNKGGGLRAGRKERVQGAGRQERQSRPGTGRSRAEEVTAEMDPLLAALTACPE